LANLDGRLRPAEDQSTKALRPHPWLVLLALMPECWLPTALRIDREPNMQTEQVEAAAAYFSAPFGVF
jgi:hypothetical protein